MWFRCPPWQQPLPQLLFHAAIFYQATIFDILDLQLLPIGYYGIVILVVSAMAQLQVLSLTGTAETSNAFTACPASAVR